RQDPGTTGTTGTTAFFPVVSLFPPSPPAGNSAAPRAAQGRSPRCTVSIMNAERSKDHEARERRIWQAARGLLRAGPGHPAAARGRRLAARPAGRLPVFGVVAPRAGHR